MTVSSQPFVSSEMARSVLHIGAGRGDTLDAFANGDQAVAITLVEPQPEMLAGLRRRTQGFANAKVIPAAAGREAGSAALNVYNLPELSSLRIATGALDLLPGLQVVDSPKVEVLTLSAIVAQHKISDSTPNLLVLDAPGEEAFLLEEAIASGAIDRFQHVTVYCGQEPLFEGGVGAAHLVGLLEPLFFELQDATPDALGRLCLHFRRNAARVALKELEAERDGLRQQLREQERSAADQASAARVALKELEAERDGLRQQLREQERSAADQASAAENLLSRVEEMKVALTQQTKDAAAHAEAAQKWRSQVDEVRAPLERQLRDANSSLRQANRRTAELERRLDAARAQIRVTETELVKLQAQMEIIRDVMAIPGKGRDFAALPVKLDDR